MMDNNVCTPLESSAQDPKVSLDPDLLRTVDSAVVAPLEATTITINSDVSILNVTEMLTTNAQLNQGSPNLWLIIILSITMTQLPQI